jgi:hypothetical protein
MRGDEADAQGLQALKLMQGPIKAPFEVSLVAADPIQVLAAGQETQTVGHDRVV